jgi:site-specific DNA-methyltransferase (adenine-specific)
MIHNFGDDIILYEGDMLELSPKYIKDSSVELLLVDPPYNIGKDGKDGWDTFVSEAAYYDFLSKVFKEADRILKPSGTVYIFHQKFKDLCWIHDHLTKVYKFNFKQLITWNKKFNGCRLEGYLEGYTSQVNKNRNYPTMSENILFFSKQPDHFENPFVRVMKENMKKLNLTQTHLSKLIKTRNGKKSGWSSTKLNGRQLPTRDQWKKLCEYFRIEDKYDLLINMYEEERYYFSCQGELHSVWNYSIDFDSWHVSAKPITLYQSIFRHSYRPGSLIVDLFCGSGSVIAASLKEACKLITFENKSEYVKNIISDLLED